MGQMISIETEDRIILDGYISDVPNSTSIVVHIHSSHANFYEARFNKSIANELFKINTTYLTVNTRGRDTVADVYQYQDDKLTFVPAGGAREIFFDSVLDIEGWVKYCLDKGYENIYLLGHSLGAMKVVYWNSVSLRNLSGIILLSPPDLWGLARNKLGESYENFLAFVETKKEKNEILNSSKIYESGEYFFPITEASFASLFLDHDASGMFDIGRFVDCKTNLVSKITCPVLIVFGSEGEYIVKPQSEYINMITDCSCGKVTSKIIDGANHNYHGKEDALAYVVSGWISNG